MKNDGGSAKQYQQTKAECESRINGVCEGCGRKLEAIETIDNSRNPTFWQGCTHCMCFRGGVKKIYFDIARELVVAGRMLPYSREGDFSTPEQLEYYLDSQTAGLSHNIAMIHAMIAEREKG